MRIKISMRRIWLALRLALPLLASGCALTPEQKAAGVKFGSAAMMLGNISAEEIVQSRNDVVEMRSLLKELGDPTINYADPANDVDGPLDLAEAEMRVKAGKSLAKYGELLSELIGGTQVEQIQTAADSFVGSIREVDGVSISEEKASAISTAIQALAGIFVEHKRREAAIRIVNETYAPLNQLLKAMKKSFTVEENLWAKGYNDTVKDLEEADTNMNLTAAQDSRADAMAARKRQRFEAIRAEIIDTIDAVDGAHRELENSLNSYPITLSGLDAFVNQVNELSEIYDVLAEQ